MARDPVRGDHVAVGAGSHQPRPPVLVARAAAFKGSRRLRRGDGSGATRARAVDVEVITRPTISWQEIMTHGDAARI
ncbi:hypothetical protein BHE74_00003921 [Ensete ventricosum]|nr:hypothetical protein BHE74_00003921 [Ensete ventricosum]